jgi:hypothetical protein
VNNLEPRGWTPQSPDRFLPDQHRGIAQHAGGVEPLALLEVAHAPAWLEHEGVGKPGDERSSQPGVSGGWEGTGNTP